ncbi:MULTISPECIES: NAD(P)/FAD-dependent oxidoreductase [unclassified Arthrobacter]|uniref:NAD(P)/FAD-dependent oxidoreductase n=1 Tax=unclassified Arthrobacter TaxID=235627 RepID=UPI002DFABE2A|nr:MULTISPECIES: FAD/NAD(P)-binding oxidoreductase [unclassified Arthrobacter]MEC5191703.1 sulfide:quinone oxidoreductase [Arthrobacter sp. MP_M4]MEC5203393.1 sulfide:quinone oxidoreductase [Arthrobacter sp. MP_M7]
MAGQHHEVLIIGGGNAGVSLAARLHRYGVKDVAVVEPADQHYYQPLFSHIAGGRAQASEAVRPEGAVLPRSVAWIRDAAVDIDPHGKTVSLASGGRLGFEHVVVCPGLQLDWDKIPGLGEAVHSPSGASHYEFGLAAKAWTLLSALTAGTAVFTMPAGPIKCGGAAQKPMYLACDYWREQGVLQDIRVIMVQPYPTVFGVAGVDEELNRKVAEYGIELRLDSELVAVDPKAQTALIRNNAAGSTEELRYDVLNAVPPQSAPDWLKATELPARGDAGGFVEVDPQTLRHVRFPAVWSLGDAAATSNSKSGGALRKQTKVLAKNLVAARQGKPLTNKYDGYSVCPFTVSRSTVVFAEFDDQSRPMPTVPKVPTWKESRASWVVDRDIFPQVYWNLILKGRA